MLGQRVERCRRLRGARLYRTGDRMRWLDDGTLEFLGRLDEQRPRTGTDPTHTCEGSPR